MRALLARVAWLGVITISVGSGMAAGRAVEHASGGWQDAGSLAAPRSHLSAIRLATGDILVAGGLDPSRSEYVLDTAEVLDARTGKVRVVDGEPTPRIDASVTTLADGMVLLAGGSEWVGPDVAPDGWAQVGAAELLDPFTLRWKQINSLREARADHGATLLGDGRVLVAGGHRGTKMLSSVEIFDPKTKSWTAARAMPRPRQQFSIATLPDGDVLVAGGLETNGLPSKTSLLYSPGKNTWREGPPLGVERVLHSTVVLSDGDVLLVGGQKAAAGTAERFDAVTERFVPAGSLVEPRMLAQVAALADGRVVVAGGLEPVEKEFLPMRSIEVWDPRANAWTRGPAPDEASAFGGLVAIANDVWLIAGAGEGERALDRVEWLRVP